MFVSLENRKDYTVIVMLPGESVSGKRKATCDIFDVTLAEANKVGHLLADRLSCDFTLLPYIEEEA